MQTSRFVFADKPAGVTTHTSLNESDKRGPLPPAADGFVEHLADLTGSQLFVAHRLDRETTGAICFARDSQAAAVLQELFASRRVEKTYLFITDRPHSKSEFEVESFIERRGSLFVSLKPSPTHPVNSKTRFRKLKSAGRFHLWEARPTTGKPHQIRLHAESEGIPLVGDQAHGGSRFPALCLHSQSIRFELDGALHSHETPPPLWYQDLDLMNDSLLCRWLAAIDRRHRLTRSYRSLGYGSSSSTTLRWIHSEGDPLRAEQLGDVYSLSWFADDQPSESEWSSLRKLIALEGWTRWYLQVRGNRGRAPNEEIVVRGSSELPVRWTALENDVKFEFRTDCGLSPGLFLDQRRNRQWVARNSNGLRVLNLFCYTGGFSVCAARGGASTTVSVDVSKTFLEWTKANFALNGLTIEGHEFRAMDSREYLAWAMKKGLRFDLIVCDPPSFGRSKLGVFRIEKDYESLLDSLWAVTSPGGRILFSNNFEKWTPEEYASRVQRWIKEKNIRARIAASPAPEWDFELPREPKNMKSLFIERAT